MYFTSKFSEWPVDQIFILVTLLSIFIIAVKYFIVSSTIENFQVDYDNTSSYILTESSYSTESVFLSSDKRDANDNRLLVFFRSIFPFKHEINGKDRVRKAIEYYPECAISSLMKKRNLFVSLLGYQTLTLIVPRDSPLYEDISIDTWKGKRICTFANSTASLTLRTIVTRLGMNVIIIEVSSYADMYSIWKKGDIDGIFLLCSHPNLFVEKFSFQFEVRIFNFYKYFTSDSYRKNLITFYFPSMFRTTIQMYNYRTFMIGKTLPSCSFYMVLFASARVSDDFVFTFISSLHKNFFYMKTHFPTLSSFSESTMQICPVDMEFHSGAKRYYTDKDVITETPINLSQYKMSYSRTDTNDDDDDREEVLTLITRGY